MNIFEPKIHGKIKVNHWFHHPFQLVENRVVFFQKNIMMIINVAMRNYAGVENLMMIAPNRKMLIMSLN